MKLSNEMIWHYTQSRQAGMILMDKRILPSVFSVPKNVHPRVWFSSNQQQERSAAVFMEPSNIAKLTLRQARKAGKFGQPVRFGLDPNAPGIDPMTGERKESVVKTFSETKIPSGYRRRLIDHGRRVGAISSQWFTMIGLVVVTEAVACEEFIGGSWVSADRDRLMADAEHCYGVQDINGVRIMDFSELGEDEQADKEELIRLNGVLQSGDPFGNLPDGLPKRCVWRLGYTPDAQA